jgi:hypothetical protein
MATKDWMATGHIERRNQGQKTLSYIGRAENRNRMGFAPTTKIGKFYDTEAIPKFDALDAAVSAWKNEETRNKITVKELKNAEKEFVPAYRTIYNFLKGNIEITDTDLQLMGLPPRPEGGGGKPSPVAQTAPWIQILLHVLRTLIIEYGASSTNKAKLDGQHGIELVYRIGGERPVHISELTNSVFDTRSPINLEFDEADRGKIVWFAVRWENTRGLKGPWSEIYFAIIP